MKSKNLILGTLFVIIVAIGGVGQQPAARDSQLNASPKAASTSGSGPFDKIWSVASSQFNQSDQWGASITQLANGTLVAAGGDGGNQRNSCKGFFGGAWLIFLTPGGGNVSQKLYSDCANMAQWATFVRRTADGGYILSGEDGSTSLCQPCAWLAKFNSSGTILWQEDLTTFFGSGVNIKPTSDGGYIAAGFGDPTEAEPISGLVVKLSGTGAAEWSGLFTETDSSFQNAVANNNGGLNFNSIAPTHDGGYVISGVADAKFSSGFAHVLVLMKITSAGHVQWSRAYYSSTWAAIRPESPSIQWFPRLMAATRFRERCKP